MFESFKETKLSPKDYGNAVVQWNKSVGDLSKNYVVKHKNYTYDLLKTKQSDDMCQNIAAALMEAEKFEPLGQYGKGNIDLYNRPQVKLKDGSTAAVYSSSYNIDGQEVLLPLVSDDGRIMTDDEAVEQYKKTGKYLGKFDTVEEADKYAEQLHISQDMYYNGKSSKSIILRNTINSKIEELNELGMPADTQAEVILTGLRSFLAKSADKITGAEFKAAVSDLEINGQKLNAVVPNYDYKVEQLYKEAQRAVYEDKYMAYQNHKLDMQLAEKDAMSELYKWTQQNPNARPSDTLMKTRQIVQQYGLEENGFGFIKEMAGNIDTLRSFNEVKSDPSVLQSLGAKAALGTLTPEEINNAVKNGNLNWQHGLAFTDRLNREVKEDVRAVEKEYKTLTSQIKEQQKTYSGKKDDVLNEATDKLNATVNALNSGKITPEQARKNISDIQRILNAKKLQKEQQADNDSFLLNASWIRSHIPQENAPIAQIKKELSRTGMLRNNYGLKIANPNVTSIPDKNRKIKGKASPHGGYDIAWAANVYSANKKGKVIYAGYLNDFGNYAVIKYADGTYTRIGHLAKSTAWLQGKTLAPSTFIGRSGNTGYSTGIHAHIDFWNKDRIPITVSEFNATR